MTTLTPRATPAALAGPASTVDYRAHARAAGLLYLLTFVSIPTLFLYASVRDTNYLLTTGSDTAVLVGGVLEFIVALACIGTAVALYPVLKRQNESVAMGFIGVRVLEGATIVAGIACLLTIVTLRQGGVGADGLVTSQALVGLYDRMFFLGQSMLPIANAGLLGYLLYRSRLVPRALPLLGFIGATMLLMSNAGILFGAWDRVSAVAAIAVLPIAAWEFSLGVYLLVKGFRPEGISTLFPTPTIAVRQLN
jgi:hypothetical protein